MKKVIYHIAFKLSILILVFAILTPTIVKLAHTLENHEHIICTDSQTTHFHGIDLDCEFYKFKIQTQTFYEYVDFNLHEKLDLNHVIESNYKYYSSTIVRLCFLRGPPELV
jgi:hypothetical protein